MNQSRNIILNVDEDYAVRVEFTRRRSLCLLIRLSPPEVVLRSPFGVSEAEMRDFCLKHRFWARKKLQMASLRATAGEEWSFVSGERLPYLGENYPLEVLRNHRRALFNGVKFAIPSGERDEIQFELKRLYYRLAADYLRDNTFAVAKLNDLPLKAVTIKDTRSRWGSCSNLGNINFSFRLICFPESVVNYVIVHELAHLVHLNHSREFWRLVGSWCPEYAGARDYLKQHGHQFDNLFG